MNKKSLSQKIALGTAIVLLIADIAFFIFDGGDRTFSYVTFFAGLGGAVFLVMHFLFSTKLDFIPLIASALLGIALGMHLFLGLPTLSDIVNGVNFVGGNSSAVVVFGSIFLVANISSVFICFMKQEE